MKKTYIINGTVVLENELINSTVEITDGKITDINYKESIPKDATVIDAKDQYVMPGFVEIHAHGGGGYDYMDGTLEAFHSISALHRSHGTTTILPTTVSCSLDAILTMFETYKKVLKENKVINYAGLHLEGPYLSMEMKGAQNPLYVRCPDNKEVDIILNAGEGLIKRMTVAPEIDNTDYLSEELKKRGITMSIGHSDGTYKDVEKAFNKGYNHITHMYSNTPTVRKINQVVMAGIREAAYLIDDMYIELIGDGHHLPNEVLLLALKIKGADKINLTSDAMRAAGTNVSESYLGEIKPENRVIVEDGVAKLPDRSFYAGSIATGDIMLKWAVKDCGVSINDAVKMLSLTPSKIVGLSENKGSIAVGKDADIIFVDSDLNVTDTFLYTDF